MGKKRQKKTECVTLDFTTAHETKPLHTRQSSKINDLVRSHTVARSSLRIVRQSTCMRGIVFLVLPPVPRFPTTQQSKFEHDHKKQQLLTRTRTQARNSNKYSCSTRSWTSQSSNGHSPITFQRNHYTYETPQADLMFLPATNFASGGPKRTKERDMHRGFFYRNETFEVVCLECVFLPSYCH